MHVAPRIEYALRLFSRNTASNVAALGDEGMTSKQDGSLRG